jgi:hypothetical protein
MLQSIRDQPHNFRRQLGNVHHNGSFVGLRRLERRQLGFEQFRGHEIMSTSSEALGE